jgi:hypothetical protein
MARRTGKSPSRIELRKASEAAEKKEKGTKTASTKSASKTTKKAAKKSTKKSKSSKTPERLRMVWGVFDNSNQQVAAFPYAQRADAEKKLVDMAGKGKGPYFIQPVKEPIVEEEPPAEE